METWQAEDKSRIRTRLSFDPKARFPAKLYDVANDGFLAKWDPSGTSILVDEDVFEQKVMNSYPGLVQIPSFLNLRRLFREYSFQWRVVDGTDSLFEFSHPAFIRDREDLLQQITTKRKSFHRHHSRRLFPAVVSPGTPCGKRRYRRRRQASELGSGLDAHSGSSSSAEATDFRITLSADRSYSDFLQVPSSSEDKLQDVPEPNLQLYSSTQVLDVISGLADGVNIVGDTYRPTQQDLLNILAVYAMNELTEDECFQLVANTAIGDPSIVASATSIIAGEARESISSQSVSLSSPEFTPLDLPLSPGWAEWNRTGHLSETATLVHQEPSRKYGNEVAYINSQEKNMCCPAYGPVIQLDLNNVEAEGTAMEESNNMYSESGRGDLCELRSGMYLESVDLYRLASCEAERGDTGIADDMNILQSQQHMHETPHQGPEVPFYTCRSNEHYRQNEILYDSYLRCSENFENDNTYDSHGSECGRYDTMNKSRSNMWPQRHIAPSGVH